MNFSKAPVASRLKGSSNLESVAVSSVVVPTYILGCYECCTFTVVHCNALPTCWWKATHICQAPFKWVSLGCCWVLWLLRVYLVFPALQGGLTSRQDNLGLHLPLCKSLADPPSSWECIMSVCDITTIRTCISHCQKSAWCAVLHLAMLRHSVKTEKNQVESKDKHVNTKRNTRKGGPGWVMLQIPWILLRPRQEKLSTGLLISFLELCTSLSSIN